jgi:hypothetical protein
MPLPLFKKAHNIDLAQRRLSSRMPELSMQDNITLLSRVIFFADISVESPRDGKIEKYNFRSATGRTRS